MNKLTATVTQSAKEQVLGVQQVTEASETIARTSQQVKDATLEQKRGGEVIVKAVENISEIARSNLSAVDRLSGAATTLSKQAEGLQQLVTVFKVA